MPMSTHQKTHLLLNDKPQKTLDHQRGFFDSIEHINE